MSTPRPARTAARGHAGTIAGDKARHRWAVASRLLAATAGGYAVSACLCAALALWLPRLSGLSRAQSVLLATLLSFVVYALLALAVFCVRSAGRAWRLLGALALLGGLLLAAWDRLA